MSLKYPSGILDAVTDGKGSMSSVGAVKFDIYNWEKNTPVLHNTVYLYLPLTLTNQTVASWDHHTFTPTEFITKLGEVKVATAAMSGDAVAVKNDVLRGIDRVMGNFNYSDAVGNSAQYAARKLIARDQSGEAMAQMVNKTILTPYMSLMFRGMSFRKFSFEFRFTPRNEKESMEIYNIIKEFRMAQHPESIGGGFQGYPREIEITYLHSLGGDVDAGKSENHWLNKFKKCVLDDVSLNYTSTGAYVPMRDGFPSETVMTLSLTENELLTRADIASGY